MQKLNGAGYLVSEEEMQRIQQMVSDLAAELTALNVGQRSKRKKKKYFSKEARRNMSLAQKRRWAKKKGTK
jgi:hypothetical protein